METRKLILQTTSYIPKGAVATYGQIAKLSLIKSARYVGSVLHNNQDPVAFPCHRVVNARGETAEQYPFGGWKILESKIGA